MHSPVARRSAARVLQRRALDLLGGGQWQFIAARDVSGRLEVGEPVQAVAQDADRSFRPGAGVAVHDHAGEHLVAAQLVGHGGDGRGDHAGVFDEGFLHLDRRDVLAAAPDHVLLPVHEVQQAVGIPVDQVAGMEIAPGPGRFGCRGVFQVAAEKAAPRIVPGMAYQQFAGPAGCGVPAAVVDDAEVDAWRRAADAAGAGLARFFLCRHRHTAGPSPSWPRPRLAECRSVSRTRHAVRRSGPRRNRSGRCGPGPPGRGAGS